MTIDDNNKLHTNMDETADAGSKTEANDVICSAKEIVPAGSSEGLMVSTDDKPKGPMEIAVSENPTSVINIRKAAGMIDRMAASLDYAQKIAVDMTEPVQSIQEMSGKDMHDLTLKTILSDNKETLKEKLDYIDRENSNYEQRLDRNAERYKEVMNARTQNVGKAAGIWIKNLVTGVSIGAFTFVVILLTPVGKKYGSMLLNRTA